MVLAEICEQLQVINKAEERAAGFRMEVHLALLHNNRPRRLLDQGGQSVEILFRMSALPGLPCAVCARPAGIELTILDPQICRKGADDMEEQKDGS